jgi:hypothetical protein
MLWRVISTRSNLLPTQTSLTALPPGGKRFFIQVIAMSGAFSGHAVPAGVAAHAFYEKATSLVDLLQIVNAFTLPEPYLLDQQRTAPIWITRNGHAPAGTEYVMIACPECLRTFPQVLNETTVLVQHANCLHCHTLIDYAIVQPADPASPHRLPSGNQPQMPPWRLSSQLARYSKKGNFKCTK